MAHERTWIQVVCRYNDGTMAIRNHYRAVLRELNAPSWTSLKKEGQIKARSSRGVEFRATRADNDNFISSTRASNGFEQDAGQISRDNRSSCPRDLGRSRETPRLKSSHVERVNGHFRRPARSCLRLGDGRPLCPRSRLSPLQPVSISRREGTRRRRSELVDS